MPYCNMRQSCFYSPPLYTKIEYKSRPLVKNFLFSCNALSHQPHAKFSLNKNFLTLATALFSGLALSVTASATEYSQHINGNPANESQYNSIRTGNEESGYTYTFTDGDSIVITDNDKNYVIGCRYSSDITLIGNIAVQSNQSTDARVSVFSGLYNWTGSEDDLYTLTTDDIKIDVKSTGTLTNGTQNFYVNGIYNTWGITHTGTININSVAYGDNAYAAVAQGIVANNGGQISFNGGTITAIAENDGYAAQAVGISSEGHNVRTDNISAQGATVINVTATNTGTTSSGFASAFGINNTNDYGLTNQISLQNTDITVTAVSTQQADAVGVYTDENGNTSIGTGKIEVFAESDNGNGYAYGFYADNGTINYAGGAVTVKGSRVETEAGIYVSNGGTLNINGNSSISAGNALVGNGTVNVAEDTVSILDGAYDDFDGVLNSKGATALGVTAADAQASLSENDVAALVVYAGSTLTGNITVGTKAQGSTLADSKLNLLSDGTLVIFAAENYDGTAPLLTVDEASSEEGSKVRLVNSARVKAGTIVFDVTTGTSPDNYVFETDNLLTAVEDNKITVKSAQSVFGNELLMPNVVSGAIATTGEGSDRIIALTTDSDLATAASALNNIALMAVAGGAQIAALDAIVMIDDTLEQHGSKLISKLPHNSDLGDVWVEINGNFAKADSYKAGSTSYGIKSDLAGVTLGTDYVFNSAAFGLSLSLGSGSVRGQGAGDGIKNEVDYWGVNLYTVFPTEYINFLANIGYMSTENDISQGRYNATVDVNAYSVALRAEMPIAINEKFAVIPHIGARYQHIDMDDFSCGGFTYTADNIDLVQIPVGVAFSGTFDSGDDLSIKPYLDLEIAPNLGDKNTDNTVGLSGTSFYDVIDTRVASSVLYSAKLGLNFAYANHSFGVSYGVTAGNGERFDQGVQAEYRFRF
ncbi:MAG: autotransporter domain-containing protein [Candidatus Anaerobiospirillum merdipullorum]|uniref:Autotransporter domain-containing protein n=1 Tax=Candidatus Anaerobiospirillum merdipullorum TaxID=2838450 RepID=A0A9E2KQ56_9GAMM|nr:autotransporter domain-containing protein [Candidatus Anaerobiospirillum merdipullorum]